MVVKRGQYKTGRIKLAAETGLSEQQIRTCLKRLESTSEITITKYNKFSVITISNWNEHQQKKKKSTNNQPATNQQLTTNNNVNNKNNDNNTPQTPQGDFINFNGLSDGQGRALLALREKYKNV